MWRSHLTTLFVWAAGTFALALACGIPAVSDAVNDSGAAGWTTNVLNPRMSANGVEFTVTTADPSTQPSQGAASDSNRVVTFVVRALNRTDSSATGNFTIRMTSVAPTSPIARVMPMPTEIWKDSGAVVLDAGQSKTFTFTSPSLPEKRMFTLILGSGVQSIPMLTLSRQKDGALAVNR
ncbi:MAG: hypothetical protein ABSH08_07695 [Tepidisphaeraceae bacterium]